MRNTFLFAEQQNVLIEDAFHASALILDLGGGGEGMIGQLRGRQVVAIDLRREELEECASGPIKVVADARALPFLDKSFDAITASCFLMDVPQSGRGAVLAERFGSSGQEGDSTSGTRLSLHRQTQRKSCSSCL